MSKTLAVIVGISEYKSFLFPQLPAAAKDAARVAQSFAAWGVFHENINLLLDEEATRENILKALRIWVLQKSAKSTRILFYFAGHGSRVEESGQPASSVLITYDSVPGDRLGTGITLSEIINAVARVMPIEAYLFLDACALRFESIENIVHAKLPDSEVISGTGAKCLFCMVAAGEKKAYEDKKMISSYFTNSLLNNLAEYRLKGINSSHLGYLIEKDLTRQGLPAPESYLIGSQDTFPLPISHLEDVNYKKLDTVLRAKTIALLQDLIIKNPKRPIWLWGDSGMGKSILIQQLIKTNESYIYYSVPRSKYDLGLDDVIYSITQNIKDQLILSKRQFSNNTEFFKHLEIYSKSLIIVIDHLERVKVSVIKKIITFLQSFHFNKIYVSQLIPDKNWNVIAVEQPRLSISELKLFYGKYKNEKDYPLDFLLVASKGSPFELKKILSSEDNTISKFFNSVVNQEIVSIICACQGYIDEILFREVYSIEVEKLNFLTKAGFISYESSYFVAHDTLNQINNNFKRLHKNNEALKYWNKQIAETPQILWGILTFSKIFLGITSKKHINQNALNIAFESLVFFKEWTIAEELLNKALSFIKVTIKPVIYMCNQFNHISYVSIVETALSSIDKCSLEDEDYESYLLIKSEMAYWMGEFYFSINQAQVVVKRTMNIENRAVANLNIGIAFFFLGQWTDATYHLDLANSFNISIRTKAWSRMILATIYGLRGVDIVGGKNLFNSSIRLLDQIQDYVGLGIAWNNYGEMSWKLKEYRTALIQLHRGKDYAISINDYATLLEISRNLIHVTLRFYGINSIELQRAIEDTESLLEKVKDQTEMMQVLNTLATVDAYRGAVELLEEKINKVSPLTKNNMEYDIYTLSNQGILFMFKGEYPKAKDSIKSAIKLAKKGDNFLAIEQIKGDLANIERIHGINTKILI